MGLLDDPPVVCRGRALDSARLRPLVAEARALAAECFHPECLVRLGEGITDLWLLVARPRLVLLGYVLVYDVQLEASRTDALVIDQLAVAPPLRRCGVGAELVKAVLHHAATLGCELVVLWSVATALTFYRALGFREVSTEARDALRKAGVPSVRSCVPLARAPPTEADEVLSVVSDSEPPSDEETAMHDTCEPASASAVPLASDSTSENCESLHDESGRVWGHIQGVLSRPLLNGRACLVTGYDPVRQRYSVRAEGTSEQIALRRDAVQLPVGTSVQIPEAPGHIGNLHAEIAEVLDDTGYRVAIESGGSDSAAYLVQLSWHEVVVNFRPSLT